MEPIRNFWVVGGDQRQVWLARLLAEDGHTVHTYALDLPPDAGDGPVARSSLERIDRADCVVLPLPVAGEGLTLHAPLAPAAPPLAQHTARTGCAGGLPSKTNASASAANLPFLPTAFPSLFFQHSICTYILQDILSCKISVYFASEFFNIIAP